jgi:phosphoglycerate dehydrogenase-like enzyme
MSRSRTTRAGRWQEEAALSNGQTAGAGIDVFDHEPPPRDHPVFKLGNVILSPHALAQTESVSSRMTTEACANILSLLIDGTPSSIVNRDVLERPKFTAKLARLGAAPVRA